jgi:6-pyruvoyltetrahydropterin/6-carboxytetrahydropterin synthase
VSYILRRSIEVHASHRITAFGPDHKCARPHGHNWLIVAECAAKCLPESGVLVDAGAIKKALDDLDLDHRDLNDHLNEPNLTMERLAVWIWYRLLLTPIGKTLRAVEVHETDRQSLRFEGGVPE